MGALLMERDGAWSTGRVYFDMRAYLEWKQEKPVQTEVDVVVTAVAES